MKMSLKIFSIICIILIFNIVMAHATKEENNLTELTQYLGDSISSTSYVLVNNCTNEYNDKLKQKSNISEKTVKLVDEKLWTKDIVNYREGPGEKYKKINTLEKDKEINRVGVSNNNWSKIIIDGHFYYIKSDLLTNEDPEEKNKEEQANIKNTPAKFGSGTKCELQQYAKSILGDYGWEESEIDPLIHLWNRESGWNPSSHNGSSGAHGIPQALPGSKMASEGSDWETNGKTQIRWGLKYIKGRYGSPSNAWNYFCNNGWY